MRPAITRGHSATRIGTVMALSSAAAFGSSGPMAKALLEAGWTVGAIVGVRLGGGAIVLGIAAAILLRGRWRPTASAVRTIVLYGVIAMAGCQIAFFNAVRTLDVGVALMIEYLAPVLLLAWASLRTRTLPRPATLVGAGLTLVGLAFVLDLGGTSSLDPVGVLWALLAAAFLGGYFVLSAKQDDDLPPLVIAAGGTAVAAVVIVIAGAAGMLPIAFTVTDTTLAGSSVSWVLPAAWLALVTTVFSYLTGIGGMLRLGSRVGSFLALTEVMFAVLVAWLLLAELPGPIQLVGGALIVAGIVLIRRAEAIVDVPPPAPALEPATAARL